MLRFMVLDAQPSTDPSNCPVVSLFGVCDDGSSVCLHSTGFRNFFYCTCPDLLPIVPESLTSLMNRANVSLGPSDVIDDVSVEFKTPLMFYRPNAASNTLPFLKITHRSIGSQARVVKAFLEAVRTNTDSEIAWANEAITFEDNVSFLTRFMVEANLSGGSWAEIPLKAAPDISIELEAPCSTVRARVSNCAQERECSWTDIHGMAPDILQHSPLPKESSRPAPLKLLTLSIQCGSSSGRSTPVAKSDPVIAIANYTSRFSQAAADAMTTIVLYTWPVRNIAGSTEGSTVSWKGQCLRMPTDVGVVEIRMCEDERHMLCSWEQYVRVEYDPDVISGFDLGARDVSYLSARMQKLGLGGLVLGRHAQKENSKQMLSDVDRSKSKLLSVKKVVNYGKNWVKSQARMTAISNQECFQVVGCTGRLVLEVLRAVLTQHKMSYFTLDECVSVFLHQHRERMELSCLTNLWMGKQAETPLSEPLFVSVKSDLTQMHFARFVRYCVQEAIYADALLKHLQILPEMIELAKITGLTFSEVIYRAQMARTWSLLLRVTRLEGYVVGGATDSREIAADTTPFLFHPLDNQTQGYYREPVIVVDFASLYPSIFIAYNLCYSTLMHPSDVTTEWATQCSFSPASEERAADAFVLPHVRKGLFPRLLEGLLWHRSQAKGMLQEETDPHIRAVLDGRQQALKVCANAAYGFTGSNASPFQCVPLAESCLRYGQQLCRTAMALVHEKYSQRGLRVIYGQTDSLMILCKNHSVDDSVSVGKELSVYVSNKLPLAINLKFERVLCPFLLDITNYYSGVGYDKPIGSESLYGTPPMPFRGVDPRGELIVKGFASERRGEPAIAREIVRIVLEKIIRDDDVSGAIDVVCSRVATLLRGQVDMSRLIVTKALWRTDMGDIKDGAAGNVKDPHATAHVALAERLHLRDPSRQFLLGERVPHVFVIGEMGSRQFELAEDPQYALTEGLHVDYKLYWEHKIRPHLERILRHVTTPAQLHRACYGEHTHLRSRMIATGTGKGTSKSMLGFVVTSNTVSCITCRRIVKADAPQNAVCEECRKEGLLAAAFVFASSKYGLAERRWHEIVVARNRTSSLGSHAQEVNSNFSCALMHAHGQLQDALATLSRFGDWDGFQAGELAQTNISPTANVSPDPSHWSCHKCTFDNVVIPVLADGRTKVCEMCGELSGSTATHTSRPATITIPYSSLNPPSNISPASPADAGVTASGSSQPVLSAFFSVSKRPRSTPKPKPPKRRRR